jgi:hypothetical protein
MSETEIRTAIEAHYRKSQAYIDAVKSRVKALAATVIHTAVMHCVDAYAQRTWEAKLHEAQSTVGYARVRKHPCVGSYRGILRDLPAVARIEWATHDEGEPLSIGHALYTLTDLTVRNAVVDSVEAALRAGPHEALCALRHSNGGLVIRYTTPNHDALRAEVVARVQADALERSARGVAATAAHRPGSRTKAALRTPKSAAATH